MDYELIFYLAGGVTAVSAVIVSFLGLRLKSFPGRLGPIVALWFVALIGLTTTFAVLHSQHEEEHHEEEVGLPHATEEAEKEEAE
jgi:putative Mn2+ efflux pump MntP